MSNLVPYQGRITTTNDRLYYVNADATESIELTNHPNADRFLQLMHYLQSCLVERKQADERAIAEYRQLHQVMFDDVASYMQQTVESERRRADDNAAIAQKAVDTLSQVAINLSQQQQPTDGQFYRLPEFRVEVPVVESPVRHDDPIALCLVAFWTAFLCLMGVAVAVRALSPQPQGYIHKSVLEASHNAAN